MENSSALTQFRQMKYGLFIHFGLYSLLGGEWQGQITPGLAEWIQNDLNIPVDEYARLAKQFDPKHFDAHQIASKAKQWGMQYLCFTAKHHDGFALFDTQVSDFNSVKASPCQRDFVAELAEACRQKGLKFCLYYSQAQDWHHAGGYRAYYHDEGQNDTQAFETYFESICLPQVSELLSHYGEISMLWFDTPMGMTLKQSQKLVALVKSLQADCLINGRIGHGLGDYLSMADNRIPRGAIKSAWEVPVTLNQSWGYKASDEAWTSPAELIKKWLKIISRGGNILLNVGPRGDGSLPEDSTTILDTIGAFLTRNAEAFYHTLPTPEYVFELDGVYFTHKPGLLYITVLEPKKWTGKWLSLYHMKSIATQASFLASGDTLELRVGKDLEGFGHWVIRLPETLYAEDKLGWVIKVRLESENFEVEALE